jgi:3',5'-cyclic AMP phosphodiesterase CpdA
MLIGQITDLHILENRALVSDLADTSMYLESLNDHLFKMEPPLTALVMTGDLADKGHLEAYRFIAKTFSRWGVPIYALPGNHDDRANLASGLGSFIGTKGPGNLSYSVTLDEAKLVMLDTIDPGLHSGAIDQETLRWLQEELASNHSRPTMVFTHHPPFFSGFGALDEPFKNAHSFLNTLSVHPRSVLCVGHLHSPLTTSVCGVRAIVAPPAAMPITLEISPEGGKRFGLAAPGYAIHHLTDGRLISYFGSVPGNWPYCPIISTNPAIPLSVPQTCPSSDAIVGIVWP